ncbi:MAG: phosphatase PAP2 family protein [Candidatus Aminicenantes bacterium]
MFQTEIILFLQSYASGFLTIFFKFFTEIGRSSFVIPIMLVILFGVSFRSGFVLVHLVLWNGIITNSLKELFSLPRPANVDSNILLLGENFPNPTPFTDMGAKSFFGRLPQNVVDYLRVNRIDSWGFPSGHSSMAIALWGSISLFFKKIWVWIIAGMMIIFIPLSRMYLGRHFLADVMGGLLLGFLVLLIFYNLVFKKEKLMIFLFEKLGKVQLDLKSILFLTYFLIVPLLLLFVPKIDPEDTATILGLNLGFLLLWFRGIPKDSGKIWQRMARVGIAFIFYYGISEALEKGTGLIFKNDLGPVEFIRQTLTIFLIFWGSTEISIKLGFFRR